MHSQKSSKTPLGNSPATRKIYKRILPLAFLMFLVNYADRTALSFAAPAGMTADLSLSATMLGFAAGIFFISYVLLEVPSNLMLQRVGARKWLGRIMITWGIVTSLTAFVQNYEQLLLARFLLGAAEAGFGPGIILYLTFWFSNKDRVKAFSLFLVGGPVSTVLIAPFAAWLISVGDGIAGVEGWRLMLFVVGVPALIVGIAAFWLLTDRPSKAKWLTDSEKADVLAEIEMTTDIVASRTSTAKSALRNPLLWLTVVAYFGLNYAIYGVSFFLPTIVATLSTNTTAMQNSLIIAIPYAVTAVAMVLWARHSSKSGDIGRHVLTSTFTGAAGILLASMISNPLLMLVGFSLCAAGAWASAPVLWGLPAKLLVGTGAAVGLALYNSVGLLGGFVGPYVTGWLRDSTGDYRAAFFAMAGVLVLGGLIAVFVDRRHRAAVANVEREGLAARNVGR
jgi:MFS family permease